MKKKILIIEDEKDFVTAISVLIEAEGFEVFTASDGMEGLEKIRKGEFDLIITDVMMPKMDGFKLCRMIKFDSKHKHTPVLMLTAKGQEGDRITGEQCGADAYVLKSQSPDALISKIKEMIKK